MFIIKKMRHLLCFWLRWKTLLWKTLSTVIRSEGEIILNVVSIGIASLLLSGGGKTTHSRFKIPLNLNEDSPSSINPDSDVAKLLDKPSLIIWDEVLMIHKHAFKALDRSLRDIYFLSCSQQLRIANWRKTNCFLTQFYTDSTSCTKRKHTRYCQCVIKFLLNLVKLQSSEINK